MLNLILPHDTADVLGSASLLHKTKDNRLNRYMSGKSSPHQTTK